MKTDGNEMAFPSQEIDWTESAIQNTTVYDNQHSGLTKREYFAAINPVKFEDLHLESTKDLQLLASELDIIFPEKENYTSIAMLKFEIESALTLMRADALINELNKEK